MADSDVGSGLVAGAAAVDLSGQTGIPLDSLDPALWGRAQHLRDALRESCAMLPRPTGWHILVQQYIRPDRVGGILLPEVSKREDQWQGRVGVVLAVGEDAYCDEAKYPAGAWCRPGDWVMWPSYEQASTRFRYGKAVLALLPDERVILTGIDPELVTGG